MRELQIAPREPEIDSGIPPVQQITQCESKAKANKCLRCLRNTFCGRAGVRSHLEKAATTEWARSRREYERQCRRFGPPSVTRHAPGTHQARGVAENGVACPQYRDPRAKRGYAATLAR